MGDAILQIVLGVLTVISSGSAIVIGLMFRKQTARVKNAEAVEKEVQALRGTVVSLQKQQEFYEKRLEAMQKLIIDKDNYIAVISHDKEVVEIKHAKNKSAINRAHECEFCRGDTAKCPVLAQRMRNEEEYLQSIEKRK